MNYLAAALGGFLSGMAGMPSLRIVLSLAVIAWVLAVGVWRVLDYCECCHRAWAWRRRVLDDGKSSPLCARCAKQVDRMRRQRSKSITRDRPRSREDSLRSFR